MTGKPTGSSAPMTLWEKQKSRSVKRLKKTPGGRLVQRYKDIRASIKERQTRP